MPKYLQNQLQTELLFVFNEAECWTVCFIFLQIAENIPWFLYLFHNLVVVTFFSAEGSCLGPTMQKSPIWLRLKIGVRGPREIKRRWGGEIRPAESSRRWLPAGVIWGAKRLLFLLVRSLFFLRGEQVGRLSLDAAADTNTQGEL